MCSQRISVFSTPTSKFSFPLSQLRKLEIDMQVVYDNEDSAEEDPRKVMAATRKLGMSLAEHHSLQDLLLRIAWVQPLWDVPVDCPDSMVDSLILSGFSNYLRNIPTVRLETSMTEDAKRRHIANMQGNDEPLTH